jgi:hypothetical protein
MYLDAYATHAGGERAGTMEGAMSGARSTDGMSADAMSTGEMPISKSMVYRRKAATCARLAHYALEPGDRDRLLCMQEAWLALAANEDWLEGAAPVAESRTGETRS